VSEHVESGESCVCVIDASIFAVRGKEYFKYLSTPRQAAMWASALCFTLLKIVAALPFIKTIVFAFEPPGGNDAKRGSEQEPAWR